jgi:hypothetical protein
MTKIAHFRLKLLLFMAIIYIVFACHKDTETPDDDITYEIGQEYGGGLIFYLDNTGKHGLIAYRFNPGRVPWGCEGDGYIGASKFDIGGGLENTQIICNNCSETGIAARLCLDMVYAGHDDWYLPSLEELRKMYLNLHLQGEGNFNKWYYWSSTEHSSGYAWRLSFGNGLDYQLTKSSEIDYRPIRAF